ncbi:MAG: magnesium/cobalt transporter CorA [Bacteroidales bacterium]|nr:MAG: magnesium/cobalt transporter CorA [Bacteroidales bacterium]
MARFLKSRKKSHGEVPGSLIFIGKQKMEKSRIRVIQYNKDYLVEKELDKIEDAGSYVKKGFITWINIDGLHEVDLMEKLQTMFKLSSLALEDILNTDQRPKFIEDENNLITILKAISYNKESFTLSSEQISFILGNDYLITLQERVGDYFEPVRERIRKSRGRIRVAEPDYLCYALFDSLVDSYIMNIETVGGLIEEQEDAILKGTSKRIIEDIYKYKTEMSYMRKSVRPVKEVMTHLMKSESKYIHKKTYAYLHDLDDLVTQALEALEIFYNMVSDQLTVYHTNISNRVNDVMKVLTIFASIFIPLTFVAGIYGTNFDYLPELHFKWAYFAMLGVMVCIAGLMLLYFKRKKWL